MNEVLFVQLCYHQPAVQHVCRRRPTRITFKQQTVKIKLSPCIGGRNAQIQMQTATSCGWFGCDAQIQVQTDSNHLWLVWLMKKHKLLLQVNNKNNNYYTQLTADTL